MRVHPVQPTTTRIDVAIAEALDAIGDDPGYREARRELDAATEALAGGTTREVQDHLDRALLLIDQACPI